MVFSKLMKGVNDDGDNDVIVSERPTLRCDRRSLAESGIDA
jgi:hypothetical protein